MRSVMSSYHPSHELLCSLVSGCLVGCLYCRLQSAVARGPVEARRAHTGGRLEPQVASLAAARAASLVNEHARMHLAA